MIKILGDGWWSSLGFSFTSEEVAVWLYCLKPRPNWFSKASNGQWSPQPDVEKDQNVETLFAHLVNWSWPDAKDCKGAHLNLQSN